MLTRAICFGLAIAMALAPAAVAQTSPSIVAPNRPDQNAAPAPPAAPSLGAPRVSGAPVVKARNPNKPFAPFTLASVALEGSSLPPAELDQAWRPLLGRTIDQAALDRLIDAIADRYARSNVALYTVLVPDQRFEGGVVRIQVIEGYLQGVRLEGVSNRKRSGLIGRYVAPLLKQRPLRKASLERQVSLIRDMAGLYPSLSFERGDAVGAVRLVITAKPRLAQLGLGINNRGTALLGRVQAEADLYLNSILLGGDQLHATVLTPTEADLFRYYALSYAAPLGADGTMLQVSAGYLQTHPHVVPLKGQATSLGLQITHPLIRGYETSVYLTADLDGVNSDNALLGRTFTHEDVRTARVAVSYNRSTARNVLTLSATGSFGLPGLGAREFDPGLSRTDFKKFNAKLLDNVGLGGDFILRLDGFVQLTGDILPISEQLALGGDEFGRAYESATITGDDGEAGSAELAWRPPRRLPAVLAGSEAYTFVDGGQVTEKGRFGLPDTTSRLASVGGGVRADLASHAVVQLEAARGLTNPVPYENHEVWRLVASLRTLF